MRLIHIPLIILLGILVALVVYAALLPTNTKPNPAVSKDDDTGLQKITNVVGIKVEPHPNRRDLVTLVVLTTPPPNATPPEQTSQLYRVVLIRAAANDIFVHTNRSSHIPAKVLVKSGNDCSDGACAANTVRLFLHSLDELH